MTDQEINIAIAETCGKKYHKPTEEEIKSGSYYQYQPDYCHNLNAMHEAESRIESREWRDYYEALAKACKVDTEPQTSLTRIMLIACAPSAKRAEAFLRVKGLWQD